MHLKKNKDKTQHTNGIIFNDVTHLGFDPVRKWDSFSPEKKKKAKTLLVISIIIAILCIAYLFITTDVHSYFKQLAEPIKGPVLKFLCYNFPAIIDTILCIVFFIVTFYILKFIHCQLRFHHQKTKTLVSLAFSILNYLLFITCLLLALTGWGVDTVALLASAGIITLVVGLGAQSLVEDLLAGIVIALEGNIQVGDIVSIDDFVGTIREIGLRVTIIENLNNYQQVVRNSEINIIINTSKSKSYNKITFAIPNAACRSNKMDSLLTSNLERLKGVSPSINEVQYLGLVDVTHMAATYCVAFTSEQKRAIQCRNLLLQEIYRILEENEIFK